MYPEVFLSTPSARRATAVLYPLSPPSVYFYPRPPRGGRPGDRRAGRLKCNFYPRPPRGGRRVVVDERDLREVISIHALREEGDPSCSSRAAGASYFYPRPPRGGRRVVLALEAIGFAISIHALREEGDSKNGEKHLRFCFIIKRSAQIWKSFSKNIRKNSCDLHRTA